MNEQHPTKLHFHWMLELLAALERLPAEIQEHSFNARSFGSWHVVVRCRGVRFRLAYHGRDREWTLERSLSRAFLDVWTELNCRLGDSSGSPVDAASIASEIARHAG